MVLDDSTYFTRRALSQLDRATQAASDDVALGHARLSDLYLERARSLIGRELDHGAPSYDHGEHGNVVRLRISA